MTVIKRKMMVDRGSKESAALAVVDCDLSVFFKLPYVEIPSSYQRLRWKFYLIIVVKDRDFWR